jgi:O-acetyl-ADP-ribose deacetylase (regulator of RNase III)
VQDAEVNDFTIRLVLDSGKRIEFFGPADITKERTEAIVNAANSSLLGGGGVDGAIHRAGGPLILKECQRIVAAIGRLPEGRAVITTGGRLPAKYVIHTVGPIFNGGQRGEALTLASCYRESIRLADDHAVASISFPSISTGAYLYPVREAANIAVTASLESVGSTTHIRLVRFVLFDTSTLQAYSDAAEKLARSHSGPAIRLENAP